MQIKKLTKLKSLFILAASLALCAALACSDDDDTNTSGSDNGTPPAATADADYALFKAGMADLVELGKTVSSEAGEFYAQSFYSFAGAALSSLRFAVENILYLKGEGNFLGDVTAGSRYTDWNEIAALNHASPYPYYFEGLLAHVQGETDEASELYLRAILNPAYPDSGLTFYFLKNKEVSELYTMRDELRALEASVYALFTPDPITIPRDKYTFHPEYLLAHGAAALSAGKSAEAVAYTKAAVTANVFDARNYAAAVAAHIAADDIDGAAAYLDAGLRIAPNNDGLNTLYDAFVSLIDDEKIDEDFYQAGDTPLSKRAAIPGGLYRKVVDYGRINYGYDVLMSFGSVGIKGYLRPGNLTGKQIDDVIAAVRKELKLETDDVFTIAKKDIAAANSIEGFGLEDVKKAIYEITGASDVITIYKEVCRMSGYNNGSSGNSNGGSGDGSNNGSSGGSSGEAPSDPRAAAVAIAEQLGEKAVEKAIGPVFVSTSTKLAARAGARVSNWLLYSTYSAAKVGVEMLEKYENNKELYERGWQAELVLDNFYNTVNSSLIKNSGGWRIIFDGSRSRARYKFNMWGLSGLETMWTLNGTLVHQPEDNDTGFAGTYRGDLTLEIEDWNFASAFDRNFINTSNRCVRGQIAVMPDFMEYTSTPNSPTMLKRTIAWNTRVLIDDDGDAFVYSQTQTMDDQDFSVDHTVEGYGITGGGGATAEIWDEIRVKADVLITLSECTYRQWDACTAPDPRIQNCNFPRTENGAAETITQSADEGTVWDPLYDDPEIKIYMR